MGLKLNWLYITYSVSITEAGSDEGLSGLLAENAGALRE
jgi:hypothetical protein